MRNFFLALGERRKSELTTMQNRSPTPDLKQREKDVATFRPEGDQCGETEDSGLQREETET